MFDNLFFSPVNDPLNALFPRKRREGNEITADMTADEIVAIAMKEIQEIIRKGLALPDEENSQLLVAKEPSAKKL